MPNKRLSALDQKLVRAIRENQPTNVGQLLLDGADPNLRSGGKTAIALVPHGGDEVTCKLIEAGANDSQLKGRVVWAVDRGRPSVVRLLIALGADINRSTPLGTPLSAAAAKGCIESLEALLEAGCDRNAGNSMATPLSRAIEAGHIEVVKRLLAAGADPEHRALPHMPTPLLIAVQLQRQACVAALLEVGASTEARGGVLVGDVLEGEVEALREVTPLHLAAHLGHAGIVSALLGAGASASAREGAGKTVFDIARQQNHTQVLAALKRGGAAEPEQGLGTLLLEACEAGDVDRVKQLLDRGADLEARDSRARTRDCTPLLLAARKNHREVCLHLLQVGADPRATDGGDKIPSMLLEEADDFSSLEQMGYRSNRSALHWALYNRNAALARSLIVAGADVHHKDLLGATPMMAAVALDDPELLGALKARGAKVDLAGGKRLTPLMLACEKGSARTVDWLLNQKAKVNRKSSGKETPLLLACRSPHPEIVKALLAAGADVEAKNEMRQTPLAAAAGALREVPLVEGQPTMVMVSYRDDGAYTLAPYPEEQVLAVLEHLLQAGAEVRPKGAEPPLIAAAQSGQLKVIARLLQAGANPRTQGMMGDDAVQTAELFKHEQAATLLKAAGGKRPPKRRKARSPVRQPKLLPIPNFARQLDTEEFRQAVARLGDVCRSQPVFQDSFAQCHVDIRVREMLSLTRLQDEFSEQGFLLFDSGSASAHPEQLTLIPSSRWQDALALFQTNGANYDIGPGDIIEWLEGVQKTDPFRLLGVGHDRASGKFNGPVANPRKLAKGMAAICPDSVEQGAGTLEALAQSLRESGSFFLWWD